MANIKELFKNIHKPTRERVLRFIRDTFFVLIGTFILAIGTELFIIPAGLVTGGVSGIAVIFQYANIMIDAEVLIAIISWTLFFIGLLFLGWRFSLQTLCSTITYPVFLIVIKYISKGLPFLLIENATSLVGNVAMIQFLSSVFGGFFVGAGCAITFLGGGSTGGLDIITFILCKFIKVIESSSCIFVIDALVVIIGFIVNKDHDIALCLEGVLSAFIASLVIDKVFQGNTKSYVAYVITDKYDEITKDVIKKINRTTSILDIEGGYTRMTKKMIMISFTMREYNTIRAIVASIDKKAFMTIHQAHEINGEGFKPLNK